ncbi:MAG: carbohydrate binding family 9 domain-containing protein [Pseudomonadota bacterium]
MPLLADVQLPCVEQAAIVVDALAEEPAWAEATTVRGFTTFTPGTGQPATGDTAVHLLADAEHLYLFFEAEDPEPGKLRASLGRRDTRWNDDFVGVYLDPAGEAQRAYLFGVTARGALMDGMRVGENEDLSWDGIWQAEARRTDTGWAAEIAIPWRILRHPADCDRLFSL